MNYVDARQIADAVLEWLEPCCEAEHAWIVGSVRRKRREVHDVELLGKPILTPPRPQMGDKRIFLTPLDKMLCEKHDAGWLGNGTKNGPRYKQYFVNLEKFGIPYLTTFKLELYLVVPPAQWGVGAVIRTGPGSEQDNFSRYCVMNRSAGGALPDGYKVRNLGVYAVEQLDAKGEPMKGESPLPMPREQDFLDFLGLGWIDPEYRHAPHTRGHG